MEANILLGWGSTQKILRTAGVNLMKKQILLLLKTKKTAKCCHHAVLMINVLDTFFVPFYYTKNTRTDGILSMHQLTLISKNEFTIEGIE